MKYKIFIPIIAGCVVAMASCSKVLDKKPLGSYDEKTVWADKNLADGFVLNTYADVIGNLYYKQNTDDWTDNNCNNYSNTVAGEYLDNSYDAGWDQYKRIRECNLIIQNVGAATTIPDADKKVMIAEAKFLRGLVYFYMAQRFGGVMLVDKVYDQNEPNFQFPRNTIQETYDFVMKDLSEASADLPETAPTGRATKAAALAFKTRVGLQGAAYVPAQKTAYLQQVIDAATAVFSSPYAMDNDYFGMFNDYGKAQASKEIILGYYRSATNTSFDGTPMQSLTPNTGNEKMSAGYSPAFVESFEGWPDRFPGQNLVDAYLVTDKDGIAKKWNQTSYYTDYNARGGYASSVLYNNRDKRFYTTVVYDSTKLFNNWVLTRDLGNLNRLGNKLSDWGMSESDYYYRKGLYEAKKVWYSDATDYSQPIIRLGEVYLNYAEALLLTGKTNEAITAINQTRQIHGGLPALGALSANQVWSVYKDERRVELVLENDRYWSVLRWAKFNNLDVVPELVESIRRVDITTDGKNFSFANITLNDNSYRVFTKRRFLFPVPLAQIQANPNLAPNNDGW